MRVDHDQSNLTIEPKAMFSNHSGSDQLLQGGSQINIIADKTHAITNITIIHNTRTQCPCRPKPIINKKDKISRVDLPVINRTIWVALLNSIPFMMLILRL